MLRNALRLATALLLVPAACLDGGPPCDSAPIPCACLGGRSGLATCAPDGQTRLACDCSEQACAPAVGTTCRDRLIYDVDGCGNEALAGVCPCPCAGDACGGWTEPAAMAIGPGCQDLTGCFEHAALNCEQTDPGSWFLGVRVANHCAVPVRCSAYAWYGEARLLSQGEQLVSLLELSHCVLPVDGMIVEPGFVSLLGGVFGPVFQTEAACLARLAEVSGPVLYHACVAATDPAPCLAVPPGPASCEPLAPVCLP